VNLLVVVVVVLSGVDEEEEEEEDGKAKTVDFEARGVFGDDGVVDVDVVECWTLANFIVYNFACFKNSCLSFFINFTISGLIPTDDSDIGSFNNV